MALSSRSRWDLGCGESKRTRGIPQPRARRSCGSSSPATRRCGSFDVRRRASLRSSPARSRAKRGLSAIRHTGIAAIVRPARAVGLHRAQRADPRGSVGTAPDSRQGGWIFIPAAWTLGRIWVGFLDPDSPATERGLAELREMDAQGEVITRGVRPPHGWWPYAGAGGWLPLPGPRAGPPMGSGPRAHRQHLSLEADRRYGPRQRRSACLVLEEL